MNVSVSDPRPNRWLRELGYAKNAKTAKEAFITNDEAADLFEIECRVVGTDHRLECDFVLRRHPAGRQKSSGRFGGGIG